MWAQFEALYERPGGRPSISAEEAAAALLLQILYSLRSERQLMEQLNYNLLFRWFVGLNPDDGVSDGTLLEAWASRRSFVPKDPPPTVGTGARGGKLLRDTHVSTTDAEARLYEKSTSGEAVPSYLGHVVTGNRRGLVVAACATQSSATAERRPP